MNYNIKEIYKTTNKLRKCFINKDFVGLYIIAIYVQKIINFFHFISITHNDQKE
jgi:hypothetical protein